MTELLVTAMVKCPKQNAFTALVKCADCDHRGYAVHKNADLYYFCKHGEPARREGEFLESIGIR